MDAKNINKKSNKISQRNQRKSELHKEHRQRVKKKFRENGLGGCYDHNVLELILFYSIPRRDTNEIAHELINRFGSFANVLEASVEDLMEVDGVGLETATLLTLLPEVFSFYRGDKVKEKTLITTPEAAIEYLAPKFTRMDTEIFVVVYLNGASEVIKSTTITQGSTTSVFADTPNIVREALSLKAKGIIIAHCHCDGFPNFSDQDRFLTINLYNNCNNFDIALCDHIIFAEKGIDILSRNPRFKAVPFSFV